MVAMTVAMRMKLLCEELAEESIRLGYPAMAEKIRKWEVSPPQNLGTVLFMEEVCDHCGRRLSV